MDVAINLKDHKPGSVLPAVIGVLALLTWFGGLAWATQVPDVFVPAVLGSAFVSGVVLVVVGEILDAARNTRYLTAIIAKRLTENPQAE